jgi:hypothetical protein
VRFYGVRDEKALTGTTQVGTTGLYFDIARNSFNCASPDQMLQLDCQKLQSGGKT